VGYAYYVAEGDRLKAVQIADEEGTCVAPTEETIADGSYPFSRKLYMYVNVANAQENPAVSSFVDLLLSDQGIEQVSAAGYVPETDEVLEQARQAWSNA
jgi:phosphate transport system substrate-binding protein